MKKNIFRKGLVFGLMVLMIETSFVFDLNTNSSSIENENNIENPLTNVVATLVLETCEDYCIASAKIQGTNKWYNKNEPITVNCDRNIQIFAFEGYRLKGKLLTGFQDNLGHSTLVDDIDFDIYHNPHGNTRVHISDEVTEEWDVSSASEYFTISCYVDVHYTIYNWNYTTEEWNSIENDGCQDEAYHRISSLPRLKFNYDIHSVFLHWQKGTSYIFQLLSQLLGPYS